MIRIVYPESRFRADYRLLKESGRPVAVEMVMEFLGHGDIEILVPPFSIPTTRPASSSPTQLLLVPLGAELIPPAPHQAVLYLGSSGSLGQGCAWVSLGPSDVEEVDELCLVGPGLKRAALGSAAPRTPAASETADRDWSRARGALGEDAFQALSGLSVAVVGAGRAGGAIAWQLSRSAPFRLLTIIDPDRLESHNRAQGVGGRVDEIGEVKSATIASALNAERPELAIQAIPEWAGSWRAFAALQEADLIVTACDEDEPRLQGAVVATTHNRVHLDLGVSIMRLGESQIVIRADARIAWGNRCLLCSGGLRDEFRAFEQSSLPEFAPPPASPWFERRAGSLSSVTSLTAAFGMQLIQSLARGRLSPGTWWRFSILPPDDTPHFESRVVPPPVDPHSCLCQFAGQGTSALPAIRKFIAHRAARLRQSRPSPHP